MFGLGMQELMIIGVVAVLLFGRRLPEVARSLGTSYREFRSGLNDIQSHLEVPTSSYSSTDSNASSSYDDDIDDRDEPTAPKFEPPTSEPQQEQESAS